MDSEDVESMLPFRQKITKAFKVRGLTIQSQAVDALLNVLQREEASSFDTMLHEIIDEVKGRLMSSESVGPQLVVTKSILADVVAEWSRNSDDVVDEALQLLDAFDTPRLVFNALKREYKLNPVSIDDGKTSLFGLATDKVRIL
jgi:flagellar hook-basal body complex protein FliE